MIFAGPARGGEQDLAGFSSGRPFLVALDLFRYATLQDQPFDGIAIDWDRDAAATAKIGSLLHVDADL